MPVLTFSDFEPWLVPELSGVPLFTIKNHLSVVVQEFCQRSKCVTVTVAKDLKVDGSDFPALMTDDKVIYELERCELDGASVSLLDEFENTGRTSIKINDEKTGFSVLNPKNGKQLKVLFTVSSKRNATLFPEELEYWIDGIVSGVLARLKIMPDKPWSNSAQAGFHFAQYNQAISKARARTLVNQSAGNLKLQPVPFI